MHTSMSLGCRSKWLCWRPSAELLCCWPEMGHRKPPLHSHASAESWRALHMQVSDLAFGIRLSHFCCFGGRNVCNIYCNILVGWNISGWSQTTTAPGVATSARSIYFFTDSLKLWGVLMGSTTQHGASFLRLVLSWDVTFLSENLCYSLEVYSLKDVGVRQLMSDKSH